MTGPVYHGQEVNPPAIQPAPYGLLSAAAVLTGPGRWEQAGTVYISDVCPASNEDIGGVWPQPCDTEAFDAVTAFTVTLEEQGTDRDTLRATLDARHEAYGTVTVVVGGETETLATVGATADFTVSTGTNYQVAAYADGSGLYPAARADDVVTLPAEAGTQTWVLEAVAEPEKRLRVGGDQVSATPFTVYEGVQCRTVDVGDALKRAERRLTLRESYWVETEFTRQWLRGPDVVTPNGSTALSLCAAVGVLEEFLAANYGGIGVLHVPRSVAACVGTGGVVQQRNGQLRTHLDNVWSFGAGYGNASPTGTPAPAGHAWLYATGPVVARRTEVVSREELEWRRNNTVAIAERTYAVSADCLQAAVLAQLPGGSA